MLGNKSARQSCGNGGARHRRGDCCCGILGNHVPQLQSHSCFALFKIGGHVRRHGDGIACVNCCVFCRHVHRCGNGSACVNCCVFRRRRGSGCACRLAGNGPFCRRRGNVSACCCVIGDDGGRDVCACGVNCDPVFCCAARLQGRIRLQRDHHHRCNRALLLPLWPARLRGRIRLQRDHRRRCNGALLLPLWL